MNCNKEFGWKFSCFETSFTKKKYFLITILFVSPVKTLDESKKNRKNFIFNINGVIETSPDLKRRIFCFK